MCGGSCRPIDPCLICSSISGRFQISRRLFPERLAKNTPYIGWYANRSGADVEDVDLPKAAIDMDGTLLDSVDLHALAWQEALLKFGHDKSGAASVSRPNICRLGAPSRRSQTCYDACVTRDSRLLSLPRLKRMKLACIQTLRASPTSWTWRLLPTT